MKTSTLLRIAAVIMLLYCAGHTLGAPWTPGESPSDKAVTEAMKSDHFPVVNVTRSYWDFYVGFGASITVFQLLQAVLLWQLGSLAKTDTARLRPIIAAFFIASVLNAVLAGLYFFAIPLAMAVLISLCLALAFLMAGKRTLTPV